MRLRLSRAKGFCLQAHSRAVNDLPAVNVARPTMWGNPFVVGQASGHLFRDGGDPTPLVASMTVGQVIDFYETALNGCLRPKMHPAGHQWVERFRKRCGCHPQEWVRNLRDHNLACWCPLDRPCHADVLLALANPGRAALSGEGGGDDGH